jgi:hypothetical protein
MNNLVSPIGLERLVNSLRNLCVLGDGGDVRYALACRRGAADPTSFSNSEL